MNSNNARSNQAAELRKLVEYIAGEKVPPSSDGLEALSYKEVQQMVYKLRVYQIELEIQNEELRRSQEELDIARTRYFDLYDFAPVGYVTLNEKGLILETNLTAATLLNETRSALIKQPIARFIHKEDQDVYYLHSKQLYDKSEPQEYGLRMMKNGGTTFWAHLAATVTQDADGTPLSRVVISDITERKRTWEAFWQSKNEHRAILQTTMDGFWKVDIQGRLLEVNETYCRMSGYSAQELLTMRIADLEVAEMAYKTASRIQKIIVQGEDRFESRHRRKDGSVFNVEVSVQYRSVNGGHFVAFLRDITERILAEEKLQRRKEKYRLIADNSNDWIYLVNQDLEFQYVSPSSERITGYSPREFMNNPGRFLEIIHPDDKEQVKSHHERVRKETNAHNLEFRIITKGGELRWMRHSCQPVHNDQGQYVGRSGTNRDITERKQAEAALSESLARYKALFNATSDSVILVKPDGTILDLNKTAAARYGFNTVAMIGKNIFDLLPAESASLGRSAIAKILNERRLIKSDERRIFKYEELRDGKYYSIRLYPVMDEMGNISQVASFSRDITDRKRAEEALQESEQHLSALTNSGRALVWASGTDKRCNYFNRIWLEFTGRTLEQGMGNGWTEGVHPDDLQRCLDIYIGAFDRLEKFSMEYRLRRFDGEYRWILDDGCPRYDSKGEFVGYIGHCLDITKRKQSEEALRESEERFKGYFDLGLIGMAVTSPEKRWLQVNDRLCAILGYSRDELSRMTWSELTHPEDLAAQVSLFEKVIRGETDAYSMEKRFIRKDGSTICAEISVRCVRCADGKVDHFVSMIQDITERKQAEARLQQAQKLESIGVLAGGIAHDFNNILYPLLGFAELLKEEIPADSPLQHHIDEILRSALRSKDLVKQILSFSRKSVQSAEPINLPPIIKEVLKLIRSSIPSTIDIQQDIDPNCGIVIANPTQIHQIVMNLVTNAFHAMEDTGGQLSVSLKQVDSTSKSDSSDFQTLSPGKFALLTVTDTGTGIEKAILDKIFDPYFTTKGVGKGTGLGLSVVHGIVKAYRGDIRISSAPGKGTEVRVYLPIMERTVEDKRIEDSEPIQGGKAKILLVDDETPIVCVEQRMLEKLGYQVTSCTSSLEALITFKADPTAFDLVLTDMTMANMTGIQLAEELISIRPDIPIIVCTGYSEKISDENAKAFGVKRVLMKPVDKPDMAKMVRKVLDEAKA